MRRDRCWRRWRADVLTSRLFRRLYRQHRETFLHYQSSQDHGWAFRFDHRLAPDAVEEVEVRDWRLLTIMARHHARKSRDTRAPCSCWCCGNPRPHFGNKKFGMTIPEIAGQYAFVCEADDQDIARVNRSYARRT